MSNSDHAKRRRGHDLERDLLFAAREELRVVGYRNLTLDSVALRAGTSKAVLYRRWANRAELVLAALRDLSPLYPNPIPDTATLRGDILAMFGYVDDDLQGEFQPLDIGVGLLADSAHDAKQHDYYVRRIKLTSIELMMQILERAEARGEITTSALPERLITLPIDLMRHEIMLTGRRASKASIVQIIDDIYLPLLRSGS